MSAINARRIKRWDAVGIPEQPTADRPAPNLSVKEVLRESGNRFGRAGGLLWFLALALVSLSALVDLLLDDSLFGVIMLIGQLAFGLILAAACVAVQSQENDEPFTTRLLLAKLWPRLWPLAIVSVIGSILVTLGLIALIVPGIFLAVCWCVSIPTLFFEKEKAFGSLSRSYRLTRGRRRAILPHALLFPVALAVLWTGLIVVAALVAAIFGLPESDALVTAIVVATTILAIAASTAYLGVLLAVIYLRLTGEAKPQSPGPVTASRRTTRDAPQVLADPDSSPETGRGQPTFSGLRSIVSEVGSHFPGAKLSLLPLALAFAALPAILRLSLVGSQFGISEAIFFVDFLVQGLTFGAAAILVRRRLASDGSTAIQLVSALRRGFPQLLIISLIGGTLIFLGLIALIIPGVVLALIWCVSVPALIFEHRSAISALTRSRDLTRGKTLDIFLVALPLIALAVITGLTAFALVPPGSVPAAVLDCVTQGVLNAVTGLFLAVIYLRLRSGPQPEPPADVTSSPAV